MVQSLLAPGHQRAEAQQKKRRSERPVAGSKVRVSFAHQMWLPSNLNSGDL